MHMKKMIKSSECVKASRFNWYDKYQKVLDEYLPDYGQGENKLEQVVTCVNSIVYLWFNDGVVYDNHWKDGLYDNSDNSACTYANWLYYNTSRRSVLSDVFNCRSDKDYESLLKRICETYFSEDALRKMSSSFTGAGFCKGDIYDCNEGRFSVEFVYDNEEDNQ